MPSEVALEKSASATLMAIEIRFEVLNGSSSYLTRKRRKQCFEKENRKEKKKKRNMQIKLLREVKKTNWLTLISSSSILSVLLSGTEDPPSPPKAKLNKVGPYLRPRLITVVRRLPLSPCLSVAGWSCCKKKQHNITVLYIYLYNIRYRLGPWIVNLCSFSPSVCLSVCLGDKLT